MSFKIKYNKSRFPILQRREDGKWGCRGCGGELLGRRTAWCSEACKQKHHPVFVIFAVKKRDNEVCVFCGYNLKLENESWYIKRPARSNFDTSHAFHDAFRTWNAQKPIRVEYDHIVPFSEGGPTTLENMRTLCKACHKKRTADWHKSRKS